MFNKLISILDNEKKVDILTVIDINPKSEPHIGQMLIIHADGTMEGQLEEDVVHNIAAKVRATSWEKPVTISVQDKLGKTYRIFWDRIINKARAIVFGGGHISQPLVQVLSLLDFEVTVVDDRPEFANQARFPSAYQVICENFHQVFQKLTIDDDTVVIIVTRGHRYDMDCLRAVMHSNTRYLGMIGSRRRIREIVHVLREEGAPEDLERRLRAPIGLDIKAETPAEIAVSIVAEVILVLRGGSGYPLSGPKEVS